MNATTISPRADDVPRGDDVSGLGQPPLGPAPPCRRLGVDLAARDRPQHTERLPAFGDRDRKDGVGRLVGEILADGEVAHERPSDASPLISDRSPQGRVAGLEGVENGADRDRLPDLDGDLGARPGEGSKVVRENDPDAISTTGGLLGARGAAHSAHGSV